MACICCGPSKLQRPAVCLFVKRPFSYFNVFFHGVSFHFFASLQGNNTPIIAQPRNAYPVGYRNTMIAFELCSDPTTFLERTPNGRCIKGQPLIIFASGFTMQTRWTSCISKSKSKTGMLAHWRGRSAIPIAEQFECVQHFHFVFGGDHLWFRKVLRCTIVSVRNNRPFP